MIDKLLSKLDDTRRWQAALSVVILVGLALVFWLPTRFPPALAVSDSYLFGFNNHLCELLFALVLITVVLLTKAGGLQVCGSLQIRDTGHGDLTVRLIVICLALAALLCFAFYWLAYGLGGISDSAYFLDRIHLMDRGQVPYRDFEFIYGSAPLYTSVALGRFLPISSESGYYLIWGVGTLIGIYLLWLSIRWLDLPSGGKRTVFLLVYALMLWLITGATLNYSALRYTLPLFAITGMCRLDRETHWFARIQVVLFVAVMSAGLLGLSPEEGLVYTIAACLYLPLRRHLMRRPFAPDIIMLLILLTAIFLVSSHAGTFGTMKRLGAGASNLPVYPGPHILFAFAAMLFLVFFLATGNAARQLQLDTTFVTLYCVGMIPGALGRCDTIHVVGYLLSGLICAMLLWWLWLPAWRTATIAFALIFLILPAVINFWWSPPVLSKALLNHLYRGGAPKGSFSIAVDHLGTRLAVRTLGERRGMAKMNAVRQSAMATSVDPHLVFPGSSPVIAAPFEYRPNKLSNYQALWIDEGYFMGTLNILTQGDVDRKINELQAHPEEDLILSPEDDLKQCGVVRGNRIWMGQLLLLPWIPPARRDLSLFVPYCTYIHQHYHFIYQPSVATFSYGLMRRNPDQ